MSETLLDLVVSLSLRSDTFTRNIKSVNKQIHEAESYFRLASAGVENFENTAAGLSSHLNMLERKINIVYQFLAPKPKPQTVGKACQQTKAPAVFSAGALGKKIIRQ